MNKNQSYQSDCEEEEVNINNSNSNKKRPHEIDEEENEEVKKRNSNTIKKKRDFDVCFSTFREFKKCIDCATSYTNDFIFFQIDKNGMSMTKLDTSHVSYIIANISRKAFISFDFDDQSKSSQELSIHPESLLSFLSFGNENSSLRIFSSYNNSQKKEITFQFAGKKNSFFFG